MSYGRMDKMLNLGSTYRVQELADFINDTDPYLLAEELCKILLIVQAESTTHTWRHMKEVLLGSAADVAFDQLVEEFDGQDDE